MAFFNSDATFPGPAELFLAQPRLFLARQLTLTDSTTISSASPTFLCQAGTISGQAVTDFFCYITSPLHLQISEPEYQRPTDSDMQGIAQIYNSSIA